MRPAPGGLADRLLQGLQGLVLHLHAISSDLPANQPTRLAMERWLQSADALVQQGCADDGSGPGEPGLVALLLSLADMGQPLPAGLQQPLRLRLRVARAPRPLQAGVQQALGQLACDHVQRACALAGANRVTVQLLGARHALVLLVRDNGRWPLPLPPRDQPAADQAAPALREAARRLGGRLRLWRWPQGGSQLRLELPAQRAYAATFTKAFTGDFSGDAGGPFTAH